MIRIEYQLAFDDYAEANRVTNPLRAWFQAGMLPLIILLGIGLSVWTAYDSATPPAGAQAAPAGGAGSLRPLIGWGILMGGVYLSVFLSIRRSKHPWRRAGRFVKTDVGAVGPRLFVWGIIACAASLFWVRIRLATEAAAADPTVNPVVDVVVQFIPWVVVLGVLAFAFRRFPHVYRRAWQQQPQIQMIQSVAIDEAGIVFATSLSRLEYRWAFFRGYLETSRLFVIYISPLVLHILPKRAFVGEADLATFRELLGRSVTEQTASAFPVLTRPAPVPVVPLTAPPPLPAAVPVGAAQTTTGLRGDTP